MCVSGGAEGRRAVVVIVATGPRREDGIATRGGIRVRGALVLDSVLVVEVRPGAVVVVDLG